MGGRRPQYWALVGVAEHQVATGETHRGARGAVVLVEVDDARDAQGSVDDGEGIVAVANGEVSPGVEIEGIAAFVESLGSAAVQKYEGALGGRHLNRLEVPVEDQDRRAENVRHRSRQRIARGKRAV